MRGRTRLVLLRFGTRSGLAGYVLARALALIPRGSGRTIEAAIGAVVHFGGCAVALRARSDRLVFGRASVTVVTSDFRRTLTRAAARNAVAIRVTRAATAATTTAATATAAAFAASLTRCGACFLAVGCCTYVARCTCWRVRGPGLGAALLSRLACGFTIPRALPGLALALALSARTITLALTAVTRARFSTSAFTTLSLGLSVATLCGFSLAAASLAGALRALGTSVPFAAMTAIPFAAIAT